MATLTNQVPREKGRTRGFHRARLLFAVFVITGCFALLGFRLFRIQVVENERYLTSARNMRRSTEPVLAYRGDIYSKDGVLLGRDVVDYDIGLDPRSISEEKLPFIVRLLCDAMGKPAEYRRQRLLQVMERKEKGIAYAALGRGVSSSLIAEIRQALERVLSPAEIKGFIAHAQTHRTYPRGPFCGSLVGVTDSDGSGLEGVEKSMSPYLSQRDGRREVYRDAPQKKKIYTLSSTDVAPVGGYDVYLTINSRIQAIAEEALKRGVERVKAEGGVLIILDANTGDVLAMASAPSYDPSKYFEYPEGERKKRRTNRAVESLHEPGSVIKPFYAAWALNAGIVRRDQLITQIMSGPVAWDGGSHARFGVKRIVSDVHEHPGMTVQDAVIHSSNIGMAILGLKLGHTGLMDAVNGFQLCRPTGVGLPAEAGGRYPPAKGWSPVYSGVSMSFGYALMVSPMQLCRAFAAVINGGYLLKPRIIDRIEREDEVAVFPSREVVGRPITEETSQVMREILRLVVKEGTGKMLKIDGFEFGGKTGTADMAHGGYAKKDYLSSFEAFAPYEKPQIVALCMIEKPRNGAIYGSSVAGPVVVEVLRKMFDVPEDAKASHLKKVAKN